MLTLESLKLLNAKGAPLERGTGGTPDITYQEVADALSGVEHPVSVYARYRYAQQLHLLTPLRDLIIEILRTRRQRDVVPDIWHPLVQLAIEAQAFDKHLSRFQKGHAVGLGWWSKRFENVFREAQDILDVWDFELRSAFGDWNRRNGIALKTGVV